MSSEIIDPNTRFLKRLEFKSSDVEKIYRLISEIDTVKGQWRLTNTLSPQMVSRLSTNVLLTSAGASNRIEGNVLTDDEVKELYTKLRIKKFKNRDEEEVAGYIEILQNIFDSYSSIPFTESTILHIHKELLKYVQKDSRHRGSYKSESNQVQARDENGNIVGIIFDPTPPFLVKKEMQEILDYTASAMETNTKHPLVLIASFIFEFLAIHPFRDGNGRTSRLLTNLLLLQSGYGFIPVVSHDKIVEENKIDYYLALNQSQKSWKTEDEDISPFITFFLEVVKKQSVKALELLTKEDTESFLSEKQIQVWQFAQENPTFTKSEAVQATNLNQRTVEQSLAKLVQMNKLEKNGAGPSTRYRLTK
jgi:Fic family protein